MSLDTASFVAFLRMEADMSDEKAKRLRYQADELAHQHGITIEMESSYGTCQLSCHVIAVCAVRPNGDADVVLARMSQVWIM